MPGSRARIARLTEPPCRVGTPTDYDESLARMHSPDYAFAARDCRDQSIREKKQMGILDTLGRLFGSEAEPTDPRLAELIASIDPRLAELDDHAAALSPPLQAALAYYTQTIAVVPGPVKLDEDAPLRTQLFPDPADITLCLGRSMEVKQRLPELLAAGHRRCTALLGLRRRAQGDAAPAILTDHTVRSLADTPEATRAALRDAAWGALLSAFAQQNQYQQHKLELMCSQKACLQDVSRASRVRVSGVAQSLDAHISRAHKELSPRRVLTQLVAWLGNPEPFLRIDNRMGLTVRNTAGEALLHLPLLSSQDRRQWLVCWLEFPLDMAQAALAHESHSHRFILI